MYKIINRNRSLTIMLVRASGMNIYVIKFRFNYFMLCLNKSMNGFVTKIKHGRPFQYDRNVLQHLQQKFPLGLNRIFELGFTSLVKHDYKYRRNFIFALSDKNCYYL